MTASDPLFDVSGKSIVVVGACGGLGRAMTAALAKRGARLMLADIDEHGLQSLAEDVSATAPWQTVDITDEKAASSLMQDTVDAFGRIDALINATGVFNVAAAKDVPVEDFRRTLDVNVTGALLLSRAAARHMVPNGGSILHIASVSSQVANPNYAAYASSKAAISQLVRVLAREWAPQNIRVNALGPAMTETPLTAPQLSDTGFQDQALAVIPLGRFGLPEDLLAPMLMLISSGGGFITGQTIFVDGGRTLV
ncbi:MAG: SDR family oxidoreductase [Hyphomicrobiaceae bacterium]